MDGNGFLRARMSEVALFILSRNAFKGPKITSQAKLDFVHRVVLSTNILFDNCKQS